MVDLQIVCCMCGDIGFPDKLFHCNKCRNRFQHSYCSNYYSESAEPIEVCDWCQCEGRSTSRSHGSSSRRPPSTGTNATGIMTRSEYSGDKLIKHHHHDSPTEKGKHGGAGSTSSPRPTTRRYKLLKDVMC
ncbi:uncharacterized protein LOC101205257 [Cucumis sativus]|uniref:PHD-type zinc finger plants domain-containing protein n=1 Tax=Cucumis sativus TaxID=3659 RepID=A0A0A0KFQ0_CUCSA|nr:uncharacterized protein LOC101205257 [Cucumis sativus]KGN46561.1 hypothetical protein Csa_005625 [Cucumis sativus]